MDDACFSVEKCILCGELADCLPILVGPIHPDHQDTVAPAGIFGINGRFAWHCLQCVESKIAVMRLLYDDPAYLEWLKQVNLEREKNGLPPVPNPVP